MKKTVICAIWVVAVVMLLPVFLKGFEGGSQIITKSSRASGFLPMVNIGKDDSETLKSLLINGEMKIKELRK